MENTEVCSLESFIGQLSCCWGCHRCQCDKCDLLKQKKMSTFVLGYNIEQKVLHKTAVRTAGHEFLHARL